MDSKNEIRYLFDKYLRRSCTADELNRLLQLLRKEADADALTPQMKKIWEQLKGDQQYQVDWEQLYEKLRKKEEQHHPIQFKIRKLAAAAAVLLLIAGASLLWYFHQPLHDPLQNTTAASIKNNSRSDIAPGGSKATLTLGNGKKIILNKTATGTLASQNGTAIIKLDSSLLSYHSQQSAAAKAEINTLTTPRGGQFQLILPDGTKVWLNAASSIQFPTAFTGTKREVDIQGEAYFEVSHNPEKPFIVHTSKAKITVLGTAFNIQAYPDDEAVKTTLVTGKVSIAPMADKRKTMQMQPGQQVAIGSDGEMQLIAHADIEEITGWKNGLFVFHNDRIEDIMYRLSRWYDVKVAYENALPERHFTGAIRRQVNLSEVLTMLELAGDAGFKIQGRKIIVSHK